MPDPCAMAFEARRTRTRRRLILAVVTTDLILSIAGGAYLGLSRAGTATAIRAGCVAGVVNTTPSDKPPAYRKIRFCSCLAQARDVQGGVDACRAEEAAYAANIAENRVSPVFGGRSTLAYAH